MSRWTVKSVINNNVISARNERNQERILTGRGIGFRAKPGDEVDASRVEKEFFLKSKKLSGKLYALLAQTPEIYMEITDSIVKKAEEALGKELNETIYLNLIDHLSFAVSRMKQGMNFKNVLLWEIRNFYPKEYEAALYGLSLIEEKTGEKLPEDEAGSIAMHIVNAEYDYENANDAVRMTELVHKIVSVVRYQFQTNFDENSVHFVRFITHLKFFASRFFSGKMLDGSGDELLDMVRRQYADAYDCAVKIRSLFVQDYQVEIPEEELLYLTIYIRRITMPEDEMG